MDLKPSESLNIDVTTVVNCFSVVLVFNKVSGMDFETAYVTAGVTDDRSRVTVCVPFSEVIDLALLIGSVVIVELLEGDNKLPCDKRLERLKLPCVTSVVKFTRVTVGTVDTCEKPRVVETFTIDGLELMSCEEVVLPSILLFEVMNAVLYTLEVKDFKKRVVSTNNDIDVDTRTTVVSASADENRSVPTLELWISLEYDGGVTCAVPDSMADTFDVGNGKLYTILLV